MSSGPFAGPLGGPVASSTGAPSVEVRQVGHDHNDGDIPTPERIGMRAAGWRPVRVRQAHVEWVAGRLSERDRAIVTAVYRLRLASSMQLERLHFMNIAESARGRVRRKVLARLADWRVIMPLERRIGGERAGSSGFIWRLDATGLRLMQQSQADSPRRIAARRTDSPGLGFLRHTLTVSELYVSLTEAARRENFAFVEFQTEPSCWWPDGLGRYIKPDAYAVVEATMRDHWWLEIDNATEHMPTLKRKCCAYLDFVRRGQLGPDGIIPRVLIAVPHQARYEAVAHLLTQLPEPASRLFAVVLEQDAAAFISQALRQ